MWSVVDIAAKNDNLLLNVGPRGEDAQIAPAQLERLDWLTAWMTANAAAVQETRPWVRPGTRTVEGADVRFTARGETLFAIVRGAGGARVTLSEVAATPTTTVTTLSGAPLAWTDSIAGIAVDLDAPLTLDTPTSVVLTHVVARG